MSLAQSLLPEFDHEMASTRKALERVPEAKFGWKPHEKSMTLGRLASHLAELPAWTASTFDVDELDLAPPGGGGYKPVEHKTRQQVLDHFDAMAAKGRAALAGAADAEFFKPWTLKNGGQTVFTMPKVAVLRSFVMNHMIHHRGQLTVYLRLNDVPVPSIYGPSADEG